MLPLALMLHLLVRLPALVDQTAFVLAVAALGAGAFLLLPCDGDDDVEAGHEPDPEPWWPEFERDFREYTSRMRV
jgi:hypothetical protein